MPRLLSLLLVFCLSVSLTDPAPATTQRPQRIVSLTPAITEMLFALGLGRQVVGDTVYCDYPPAARGVAKIGDTRVNYERVASLRPDLIVGDELATEDADARLRQLGYRILAVHPDTIGGVERSILQVAQATGTVPQARRLIAHMEAERHAADTLAAHLPRRTTVLIVIATAPLYVAGRGTFMDDIVTEAGGRDAAALTGYGTLSKEIVLAHPPNVILADPRDQAALRADPVLHLLSAVRAGRFVWATDSDLLVRPGPRVTEGLLQVAQGLSRLETP